MSSFIGLPLSVWYESALRLPSIYIEAPLLLELIVPERKARLLLESSQARPPSSQQSFQKATANLTDSTVSLLSSATVFLSSAISRPPNDQRKGYQRRARRRKYAQRSG